nr:MAG TPA: hypothetical protein [Caudoviricetes sp.]
MDDWDSHTDHDFYVRAYFNWLTSKKFLVKRYTTANKYTRRFKILGTPYEVSIIRSPTVTSSHTLSVPEHNLTYDSTVSTEEIVCTALMQDNFILIPDDVNVDPLF